MTSAYQGFPGHDTLTTLRLMSVPGHPGVYVLSPYESPVSVASQQVRAINLVSALCDWGAICPGQRVGIVGAGAAGTTAACYAVARGCAVTIIERQPEVLSLFSASKRYLHPRLFDWPDPGWTRGQAELPVMSWSAGTGESVARELRAQWTRWCEAYSFTDEAEDARFLECVPKAALPSDSLGLRAHPSPGEFRWTFDVAGGKRTRRISALILAVGYGAERRPPACTTHGSPSGEWWRSYWSEDYATVSGAKAPPGRVLVVGNGDGAAADLLEGYCHLGGEEFRYNALQRLMMRPDFSAVTDAAQEAEQEIAASSGAMNHDDAARDDFASDRYLNLARRHRAILESLGIAIRDDVSEVIVTARGRSQLTGRSYALHRLLLAHLFERRDRVHYVQGPADFQVCGRDGVHVRFPHGEDTLDSVIARMGVDLTLQADFRGIHEAARARLQLWGELGLTRRPQWSAPLATATRNEPPINAHMPARPKGRLYTAFLDPCVQRRLKEHLGTADMQRLYTGRLRFLSLVHGGIRAIAQQIVDGCFFQARNLGEQLEQLDITSPHRELATFVNFGPQEAGSTGATAVDRWSCEATHWTRYAGIAKPYYFFSAANAEGVFARLQEQNQQRLPGELDEKAVQELVSKARALRGIARKDHIAPMTPVSRKRFRIERVGDLGQSPEIDSANRRYLPEIQRIVAFSSRPRNHLIAFNQANKAALQDTPLEHRVYDAYHHTIAAFEDLAIRESVWLEGSSWQQATLPLDEPAQGIPMRALGELGQKQWIGLRQRVSSEVLRWWAGEIQWCALCGSIRGALPKTSAPRKIRASEPQYWQQVGNAWLSGRYFSTAFQLPPRCRMTREGASYVIVEYVEHTNGGEHAREG